MKNLTDHRDWDADQDISDYQNGATPVEHEIKMRYRRVFEKIDRTFELGKIYHERAPINLLALERWLAKLTGIEFLQYENPAFDRLQFLEDVMLDGYRVSAEGRWCGSLASMLTNDSWIYAAGGSPRPPCPQSPRWSIPADEYEEDDDPINPEVFDSEMNCFAAPMLKLMAELNVIEYVPEQRMLRLNVETLEASLSDITPYLNPLSEGEIAILKSEVDDEFYHLSQGALLRAYTEGRLA